MKNRLVRMVRQGQLVSERSGRATLYRVHPELYEKLNALRNQVNAPEYDGRFYAVMHAIPESHRPMRDRLNYVSHYFGYRPLRPGVLIGFTDRSEELAQKMGDVTADSDDAWFSFGSLAPHCAEAAEAWVRRAFLSGAVAEKISELEMRVRGLSPDGEFGGLAGYMDLLYEALWLFNEVTALPAEFGHLSDDDARLYRLLARLQGFYVENCGTDVVDLALAVPASRLIEFEESADGPQSAEPPHTKAVRRGTRGGPSRA